MKKDDFYYLGRILKQQGKKAYFLAFLDTDEPDKYSDIDTIFIEINNIFIPFFVKEIRINEQKAIIRFDEDPEADIIELIINSGMYLPAKTLPKLRGKNFYYHEIKGFEVIDTSHGSIGHIEDILDLQKQALLKIDYQGKEILIPIADDIIQKIDRKKRKVQIQAPEGLIEMYISK